MTATAEASESRPATMKASRQSRRSAIGGNSREPRIPPTVRPVCLMPMAMPRSRAGNHSTIARPVAGLATLKPKPARTRQQSMRGNEPVSATSATITPVSA